MNKFERLKLGLETSGTGKMKAFGSSMLPILKSGTLLTFERVSEYEIGDIVFCKVKGRYIDAHKIVKKDSNKGFLIANNHGYENGWTRIVYGRVITGEYQNKIIFEREGEGGTR
jgi:SOS-response transcriptional repressor LexA